MTEGQWIPAPNDLSPAMREVLDDVLRGERSDTPWTTAREVYQALKDAMPEAPQPEGSIAIYIAGKTYGKSMLTATLLAAQLAYMAMTQPTDEQLEAMCVAHDAEESAQMGEPSLWDIQKRGEFAGNEDDWAVFRTDRLAAMKSAVEALSKTFGVTIDGQ